MTTIELAFEAVLSEWETFSLLAACIAVFIFLERERPSWHALAGIFCYGMALALMSLWRLVDTTTKDGLDTAYNVWASGIHVSLVIYLGALFAFLIWPPKRTDVLVQFIWLVVLFSEVWTAVMENINCNFWQTDIPFEERTPEQMEMSVCERVYGKWYTHIPLAFQLLVIFYFIYRWKWARLLNARLRSMW